jgi:hypothetical protein
MVHPNTYSAVQKVTTAIRFDDFAGLPAECGFDYESATFWSLGHEWYLDVYPGGLNEESSERGMISVFLNPESNEGIEIKYALQVDGFAEMELKSVIQPGCVAGRNFERSEIMKNLVNGALLINVHIAPVDPSTTKSIQVLPENPSRNILQEKMFMDEEFADVVFEVGVQQFKNDDATKKAKISPVRFPAHRLVLCKSSSSTLAELCRSVGDKTTSPIHIPDVSPDVFRHLLFHLYGGKVADDDMKSHAKEILDVADRFGVVDLKLVAEASVVETTVFTMDNLMDLLLYADSKNCALLKEAAIDFILENMGEVGKKISFNNAPGAMMNDVLTAFDRKEKMGGGPGGAMHIDDLRWNAGAMRVNDLRYHTLNDGLDVDGSRETLIAALERSMDWMLLARGGKP